MKLQEKYKKEMVIPSEIEGVFVTRIGDYAFDGVTTITSVILPDTVVSIGTRAFASSEGTITMLYLGNGVEVIGDEAFMDHGLTSVIIPDTVTLIGTRAFASLDETITTLHIGNSVEVIKVLNTQIIVKPIKEE